MENTTQSTDRNPPGKRPGLSRNLISLIGAAIAIASFVGIVFLFVIEMMARRSTPYLGMFTFIIFPAIMIMGLITIGVGMLIERRRRHKMAPSMIAQYPRIDFNNPKQRRMISIFVVFTFLFLFISSVGSYQAFEYTESNSFCGQLCHTVMNPEYVAYQNSPHARVACVDCHVGPGATWYVRSKLSGAYQVYSVLFNKYPRPIHTPIKSLRPAQETCEQCHWPEKFFGAQMKIFTHFGTDEENTPKQIRMLINTGGGSDRSGFVTGIHWHMNIANEITYVSSDDKRQIIPWVQMRDKSGKITEYYAEESKLTKDQIAGMEHRRLDCVDCHNRPTHIYVPPDRAVDDSLLAKRIDRSLPFIKQQAVDVLSKEYQSTDDALRAIAAELDKYYKNQYAPRYKQLEPALRGAITEVQHIYSTNIFPEMKVDWRTHPDNISHYYFSGCFRCHDGQHKSPGGKIIRNDCNICHTIIDQTVGGVSVMPVEGKTFQHPVDLGDFTGMKCTDCHSGGGSN